MSTNQAVENRVAGIQVWKVREESQCDRLQSIGRPLAEPVDCTAVH